MYTIELQDTKTHLETLLETALKGEEVIITQDHQAILRLVRISSPAYRTPGSAKGKITITEDFDAPLEDFQEYMP